MAEHTSDIHMEDGNPASNDERYLPDFDGLRTTSMYGDCSATELNTSWFDQSPEWHDGMFPQSSANLLPLEQSLVPEGQTPETDMFFISPNASQCDYSAWTYGRTSDGAPEPAPAITITDSNYYSQAPAFPIRQDCLFEDVYRHFPGPNTVVDMPGYDGFPLGMTWYTSALSFPPGSNISHTKDHGFVSQETHNSDSDLSMTPAGGAEHGRTRLQNNTTDTWRQFSGFNPSPNMELYLPSPPDTLLTQPTTSASPSSSTQPMFWQIANPAPVQQPLAQRNASSAKRKRKSPNDVGRELMLRGWEQRVSKRANIPASSVNIVSFEGEEKFRVVRERRTNSEKENMREIALLGGSCTRCEHARKKCEKQTPCTGCRKFWNRDFNRSLSQAKRAESGSVVTHSVIAKQTKHVLSHIYNKIKAVRNSTYSLPKFLSVLDVLTPNERGFLQHVLSNLPSRTIKDLGCYSYVFTIFLDTVSIPYRPCGSLESRLRDKRARDLWLPSWASSAIHFDKHATYRSEIIGHVSGMDADVESIYYVPRHLGTIDGPRSIAPDELSFKPPSFLQLPILRPSSTWYHFGLCPLGPYPVELVEMIKHAARCMHTFSSSVGTPLIVSRVEHARDELRKLDTPGWLTCSSLPIADSRSSDTEAEGDNLAVQTANSRDFTRIDLDTILKLTQKRLELELKRELPQAGKGMWNTSM